MSSSEYRGVRRKIGDLDCVVIQPKEATGVDALAVICHGFGAGGEDLVGITGQLLHAMQTKQPVAIAYPAALLSLASEGYGDGRAWWNLSIQKLLSAMEAGHYESIREESPPGIDEARIALMGTIGILLSEFDLPMDRLLLGGFSQGAMLSMETACCGFDEPVGGLALYSGCLIREKQWKPGVAKLKDTLIVQSHGEYDMILPLRTGMWLRDLLIESGCEVDFVQFGGPHTIDEEAIDRTALILDELVKR